MAIAMGNLKNLNDIYVTPRIPQGLTAVIEGLTKEIIRHHPEDIYIFAAHYFETLLDIRAEYENYHDNSQVFDEKFQIVNKFDEIAGRRQIITAADDAIERSGWSLNETARVLERYKTIFGNSGDIQNHQRGYEKAKYSNKYQSVKNSPFVNDNIDSLNSTFKSKISLTNFSKIPTLHNSTVKDVKTELCENKTNSKERRTFREKYKSDNQDDIAISKKAFIKKSSERAKKSQLENGRKKKKTVNSSYESIEDEELEYKREEKFFESSERKSSSRTLYTEKVKNYTTQKLTTTSTLEELQSPAYVEKIHQATDETTAIIKENVETLKGSMLKRSDKKYTKSSSSSDTSKQSIQSSEYKDISSSSKHSISHKHRLNSELSKSTTCLSYSVDGTNTNLSKLTFYRENNEEDVFESRLKETQCLMEKISSNFSKTMRRSMSAKDLYRVGNLSEFSFAEISESDNSQNPLKSSLPSVRPSSSKNSSRNYSRNNTADDFVLPRISSKSPKNTKTAENLVLPVLSPPSSVSSVNSKLISTLNTDVTNTSKSELDKTSEEVNYFDDYENHSSTLLTEQVFKDSLNVTPEPTLQQPDSLESVKDHSEDIESKKINVINSNLKDKLIEIENVGKTIESLLNTENMYSKSSEVLNKNTNIQSPEEENVTNIMDCPLNIKESINVNINEENNINVEKTNTNSTNNENMSPLNNDVTIKTLMEKDSNSDSNSPTAFTSNVYSYVLTEGSPCDIPDSVTTVIIPERNSAADLEYAFDIELDGNPEGQNVISETNVHRQLSINNDDINSAFGEAVNLEAMECSAVNIDFIHDIKVGNNIMFPRQNLDLIKEEDKDLEAEKTEDEQIFKIVTTSLEDILEKEELEEKLAFQDTRNVQETEQLLQEQNHTSITYLLEDKIMESDETDNIVQVTNNVETCLESDKNVNTEFILTVDKIDTIITSDISIVNSPSPDPMMPFIPELNLNSLEDLAESSDVKTSNDSINDKKGEEGSLDEIDNLTTFAESTDRELADINEIKESSMENKAFSLDEKYDEIKENITVNDNISDELINISIEEEIKFIDIEELPDELKTNTEENIDIKTENVSANDKNVKNNINLANSIASKFINELISTSFEEHNNVKEDRAVSSETSTDLCQQHEDKEHIEQNDTIVIIDDKQEIDTANQDIVKNVDESDNIDKISPKTIQKETVSTDNKHETIDNVQKISEMNECSSLDYNIDTAAAIKIQAGVRGFLTRKHLQKPTNSKLTTENVPQIQKISVLESTTSTSPEPVVPFEKIIQATIIIQRSYRKYKMKKLESSISNTPSSLEKIIQASLIIQRNYRKYKLRKRKQENATHFNNEASNDKILVENILQHTGEFHDCIVLPVMNMNITNSISSNKKTSKCVKNDQENDKSKFSFEQNSDISEKVNNNEPNEKEIEKMDFYVNNISYTSMSETTEQNIREEKANISDNIQKDLISKVIIFPHTTKISNCEENLVEMEDFVDLVLCSKDETVLQDRYLNFITSIEDVKDAPEMLQNTHMKEEQNLSHKNDNISDESLKEPLALQSGTPRGVIIEEIKSIDETNNSA